MHGEQLCLHLIINTIFKIQYTINLNYCIHDIAGIILLLGDDAYSHWTLFLPGS